jgi:general secretion pathway protein K
LYPFIAERDKGRLVKRRVAQEKGVALFMVLWVLILLSGIATEFCFAMRTEVNMVRNFKEQTEAYYIALAGLNRA